MGNQDLSMLGNACTFCEQFSSCWKSSLILQLWPFYPIAIRHKRLHRRWWWHRRSWGGNHRNGSDLGNNTSTMHDSGENRVQALDTVGATILVEMLAVPVGVAVGNL
ncbi:hypothetical protein OIU76_017300 [Salix suchowensis]|uniref:Uncharacterized protein n=1 Tax=Salix suchowensis TaxID=1278906 RepID=A0ABQ9C391_9ROSI|nr:hypothetical protein OIU76_017300 [Salix suchowensis]KAJ6392949.1 hypothetical protein OIU77_022430 [Salix suchowensis]